MTTRVDAEHCSYPLNLHQVFSDSVAKVPICGLRRVLRTEYRCLVRDSETSERASKHAHVTCHRNRVGLPERVGPPNPHEGGFSNI